MTSLNGRFIAVALLLGLFSHRLFGQTATSSKRPRSKSLLSLCLNVATTSGPGQLHGLCRVCGRYTKSCPWMSSCPRSWNWTSTGRAVVYRERRKPGLHGELRLGRTPKLVNFWARSDSNPVVAIRRVTIEFQSICDSRYISVCCASPQFAPDVSILRQGHRGGHRRDFT